MTTTSPATTDSARARAGLETRAFAAGSPTAPLGPFTFERRQPGPRDVQIEIMYCGVCHSDLHTVRSEWEGTIYPVVPGHEIVGRVVRVGKDVHGFKAGDRAAVGCMVDSCGVCADCKEGLEQYCTTETIYTYNSPDRHTGSVTRGGYSSQIVVDERFVLRFPETLDMAAGAPLLCAGITTYSPLKHWNVGAGRRLGVVGLGGLGHMGVKLGHAFGAHVVVFTTSAGKTEDAKRLGADEVVVSRNADEMARHVSQLDFILDTVGIAHNLDPYLQLLKRDGALCLVGVPEHPHPSPSAREFISRRRSLTGSSIGGIKETQEMLDFCGTHGIVSDVEMIPIQKINEAYERMLKSDVKYRFVIDMESLGRESAAS
ncbi:MAG: NAD(P)-dependent alcohol dehydrogenase [Gemmatimonadota bacterium]